MAFGRIFKELAANMVQAFTSRAKEVYSKSRWNSILQASGLSGINFQPPISFLNGPSTRLIKIKLIEMAFGRIFKELAANMVQAFTSRAKEVYSAGFLQASGLSGINFQPPISFLNGPSTRLIKMLWLLVRCEVLS
jgi:hypothetical protein